jgi:hypothetical protein
MVIEEPDIEIGAGVSSKGECIAPITLPSTDIAQRLVDVSPLMPPVVAVEALAVAETSRLVEITADAEISTDVETSTSALTSVADVVGSTTTVLLSSASMTTALSMTPVMFLLGPTKASLSHLLFPGLASSSQGSHDLNQDDTISNTSIITGLIVR